MAKCKVINIQSVKNKNNIFYKKKEKLKKNITKNEDKKKKW
jgi:hypothetical protein